MDETEKLVWPSHDLKFLAVRILDASYWEKCVVKASAIQDVVSAFTYNMERISAMLTMPGYAALAGERWQLAVQSAIRRIFGMELPTTEQLKERQSEIAVKANELMQKMMAELLESSDDNIKGQFDRADSNFNEFYQKIPPMGAKGVEALLFSAMIQAWTTFESLGTDLWVQALNTRPIPLAVSAINNQLSKDESGAPDSVQGKNPKLEFIQGLLEEDHETIREAGAVVKRTKKFDFSRLRGIRAAYRCAFGADAESLFKTPPFDDLDVLEGIRNVIVHRAGIVDSSYRKRVSDGTEKYKKHNLHTLSLGSRIPINGEITKAMIDSMTKSSGLLFEFVDKWFSDHPTAQV